MSVSINLAVRDLNSEILIDLLIFELHYVCIKKFSSAGFES